MNSDIVEHPTAGKSIRVVRRGPRDRLEDVIQALANDGFNYCGIIKEWTGGGPQYYHFEELLFVKERG